MEFDKNGLCPARVYCEEDSRPKKPESFVWLGRN